jgi:hypothetical protein
MCFRHRDLSLRSRMFTHPKTFATSPFSPVVLRRRRSARRSSPKIRRRERTHTACQDAGEDCFAPVPLRHVAQRRHEPAGTLLSPNCRHRRPAALQLPCWAWPAHNPLAREEACQSLFPVPGLSEEWKLYSDRKRSSAPWANHP